MSIFPTKILLATDGSEEATLAARTVADIAKKTGSELHVVHARTVPLYIDPTTEQVQYLEGLEENVRKEAEQVLDAQVEQIEAAGGNVAQGYVRLGRPAEEIVALALEIGAGLIVVGSRGLGGIRRALMGSVSTSVVHHAHCPVLVVRKEEEKVEEKTLFPTKILLATDGSEEAALAAQTAADVAEKTGSELHVVHASHVPVFDPSTEAVRLLDIEENLRKEAQQVLEAQVEQIKGAGGSVMQAHVRLGRPVEEIVTLADEMGAGLIVVGSRGLGGIRRLLIGSVSDGVVRHAHCPVLVVREER